MKYKINLLLSIILLLSTVVFFIWCAIKEHNDWKIKEKETDAFWADHYATVAHINENFRKADSIQHEILVAYRREDSLKIYWKKHNFWDKKMNAELEKLNRTGHAKDISKALVRFQDSAVKYKLLLEHLKK